MNEKRALVNLYKDIVLVTRLRIFCTTLFTNKNIKVRIQIDAFLAHRSSGKRDLVRHVWPSRSQGMDNVQNE